jgi:RNA polymerase sigma factor (sigma-70 family)
MTTVIDHPSDQELELFFSSARRYALLSAEDEQRIDGEKWAASAAALRLCLGDPAGRRYLALIAAHCQSHPPLVGEFDAREQHFVLRRELVDMLPGGKHVESLVALRDRLLGDDPISADALFAATQDMTWPASLMIGFANALLRRRDPSLPCAVADALQAWEQQWPRAAEPARLKLHSAAQGKVRAQLMRYERARDQLTLHNLRLVYTIAHRYRDRGVGLMDLIQEGAIGLMRAAEKYDYRTGFRFSTYAFNWIAQSVRRAVADRGSLIRYPAHVTAQIGKVHRARAQWVAQSGREPTLAELATATGLEPALVDELRQLTNLTTSADAPAYDDEGESILDRINDGAVQPVADSLDQRSLRRGLLREIDNLEPDERAVIMGRWGLPNGRPLSRTELADQLSVSREWVRQLEISALAKLRERAFLQEAMRDYADDSEN